MALSASLPLGARSAIAERRVAPAGFGPADTGSGEGRAKSTNAGQTNAPVAPATWAPALRQLLACRGKVPRPPTWWSPPASFGAHLETWTSSGCPAASWTSRAEVGNAAVITVVLSLAGWGQFQVVGQAPESVIPGKAFFVTDPKRCRYIVPAGSPGWTVAWLAIAHPYLRNRLEQQIKATGAVVDIESDSPLAARVLQVLHGAIKMNFRDEFAAEIALCDFVFAFERWIQQVQESMPEGQRLMEQIRRRVLANLPAPLAVRTIASELGMSRSHFSHFFRERTGLSPARFSAEVRIEKAAQMLRDSREPIKTIAEQCGFTDANNFVKAFRRLRHQTPTSFRRSAG